MWQLLQFPLCPFSRKVRLALAEKGVPFVCEEVLPWAAYEGFELHSPLRQTPVLIGAGGWPVLCDSRAIVEFLEDRGEGMPLLGGDPIQRAEVRRLVAMFDEAFYAAVTAPLMGEMLFKRMAGGGPERSVLKSTLRALDGHLDYCDWLLGERTNLAGEGYSLADLAAVAQLSVSEYLYGIDWTGHDLTRAWYVRLKSRRSFGPLLAERMAGIRPPDSYADLDL